MFLVILEPILIAHPLRLVVVPVDFPNRLHYLPALDGEGLFEFLELPSSMRQAVGVNRLSALLPVDRRRVRQRDLSARQVLDYDFARMRRPTFFLTSMFVFPVAGQNPHSRVVDVKELS